MSWTKFCVLLMVGSISASASSVSVYGNATGRTCYSTGSMSAGCVIQTPPDPLNTPDFRNYAKAQVTLSFASPYQLNVNGDFSEYATSPTGLGQVGDASNLITVDFTVPTYWSDFQITGTYDQHSDEYGRNEEPDVIDLDPGNCKIYPNNMFIQPCSFGHKIGTEETLTLLDGAGIAELGSFDYGGFSLAITDLGPPITTPEPATFVLTGLFGLAAGLTCFFRNSRYLLSRSADSLVSRNT